MADAFDIDELREHLADTFLTADCEQLDKLATYLCRAELAARDMGGTLRFTIAGRAAAGDA